MATQSNPIQLVHLLGQLDWSAGWIDRWMVSWFVFNFFFFTLLNTFQGATILAGLWEKISTGPPLTTHSATLHIRNVTINTKIITTNKTKQRERERTRKAKKWSEYTGREINYSKCEDNQIKWLRFFAIKRKMEQTIEWHSKSCPICVCECAFYCLK